jgi:Tol biopolymer transport system component
MLTPSGAKLLDFGVARVSRDGPLDSLGPTSLTPLTAEGVIVGTLKYMAPEQLQGRAVDHRADIFALSAILFEMLTGKSAFDAPDSASVIAAVVAADPPALTALSPGVPHGVRRIVRIGLAKDPAARWSSARDVALQLRGLLDEPSGDRSTIATPARTSRERIAWAIAVIAALALAAALAALVVGRDRGIGRQPVRLALLPAADTILAPGEAPQVAPDGRRIAFVALDATGRNVLYTRELEATDARPLAGTEGATLPFWAPDSRRLGFFAEGRLKVTGIDGRSPQILARSTVPRGGTWGADDVIVFVPDPPVPVQRIRASGGSPEPLPLDGFTARWFPSFLADGRHYVFLALGPGQLGMTLRIGSIDEGASRELTPSRASALIGPDYVLFRRDTALFAQRFDTERLELVGQPTLVASDVGFNAITYQMLASASHTGVLAYRSSSASNELVWLDARGQPSGRVTTGADHNVLCLSGKGTRVIFDAVDFATGAVDVWQAELSTGTTTRLTFNSAVDFYPVCSPTTADIVFSSLRDGPPDLFRLSLDAPGRDAIMLDTPTAKIATDWSRDGRDLVYSVLGRDTSWDIWTIPASGGTPRPLVTSPAEDRNGVLSPDGRWLAYVSNESERLEVYVQATAPGGAKWQISRGGGLQPQWQPDGRELYYLTTDKRLVAVSVNLAGGVFSRGTERVVAQTRITGWERIDHGLQYALAPDGSRILIIDAVETVQPLSVILDWAAGIAPR